MFKNFELTFSEECTAYIRRHYPKHQLILEYGAGGSTLLAAGAGSTVIATETDSKWLVELMGAYKEQQIPGDIIPIFADIGETKAWGYPVDELAMKQWPEYSQKPWRYCREHNLVPSLILIDGRFRVASFLTACVNVTKPTTLLFDDFIEREHYHIVKQLFEPTEIIGERMAIFEIKPDKMYSQFLLDNMHYFLDPR
jgi:protein O-GlcNAc transferase